MNTQPAGAYNYMPQQAPQIDYTSNLTAIALAALTTVTVTVVLGDYAFGIAAGGAVAIFALSIINSDIIYYHVPIGNRELEFCRSAALIVFEVAIKVFLENSASRSKSAKPSQGASPSRRESSHKSPQVHEDPDRGLPPGTRDEK